jgi:hypothetical protein
VLDRSSASCSIRSSASMGIAIERVIGSCRPFGDEDQQICVGIRTGQFFQFRSDAMALRVFDPLRTAARALRRQYRWSSLARGCL